MRCYGWPWATPVQVAVKGKTLLKRLEGKTGKLKRIKRAAAVTLLDIPGATRIALAFASDYTYLRAFALAVRR